MESLEKRIGSLPEKTPDKELRSRILAAVSTERERAAQIRRTLFAAAAAVSAVSSIPALWYAASELSHSAFASYLSLLFTDTGAALSNWQAFLLSLLESAPLIGTTFVVAALFAFLASLKALAPYIRLRQSLSYHPS